LHEIAFCLLREGERGKGEKRESEIKGPKIGFDGIGIWYWDADNGLATLCTSGEGVFSVVFRGNVVGIPREEFEKAEAAVLGSTVMNPQQVLVI